MVKIFNVSVLQCSFEEALQSFIKSTERGVGGYYCFLNVHLMVESLNNAEVFMALQNSRINFPDGMPIYWVSKFINKNFMAQKISGPDFMEAVLSKFPDLSYGFLGGSEGQASIIASRFGLKNWSSYVTPMRPFLSENVEEDLNQLKLRNKEKRLPKIIWVGLGAPKQELWMQVASQLEPNLSFLGVGAALDFYSGYKKRAPKVMQKLGLEWLFRLISEPKRLFKRYFYTNLKFIYEILKKYIFNRIQFNKSE